MVGQGSDTRLRLVTPEDLYNSYYGVNGPLWFVNRQFLTYMPLRERYNIC